MCPSPLCLLHYMRRTCNTLLLPLMCHYFHFGFIQSCITVRNWNLKHIVCTAYMHMYLYMCVCVYVFILKCKYQIQSHIRKTYLKILFQPFILFNHQFQTILQEVIHFSWYGNKVCWSQVETVPQPLWAAWHAETRFVVTEVAGMQANKRNTWYRHSSGQQQCSVTAFLCPLTFHWAYSFIHSLVYLFTYLYISLYMATEISPLPHLF